MDKFTKSLISVLVILFVIITFFVFFGGYAYEAKGILNQLIAPKSKNVQISDGINFQPYMDEMQARMKKTWKPADTSKSSKILASYKVMKNGEITDIKILKSDAGEENNKSVIDALNNVSPLPPLPMSFKGESVDVNFTFAINRKSVENE